MIRRLALGAALITLLAATAASLGGHGSHASAADRDCADFATQAEAQHYFNSHGGGPANDFDRLDADHDGIACESLPCPCAGGARGGSGGAGHPDGSNRVPRGRRLRARVTNAIDGDTLSVRLRGTHRVIDVRLIGIDTPETRRPGTPIECGGPRASASMHRMADGHRVTLVTDPSQDRVDRYGRLLAYANGHGGRDLGLAQLRGGWARVYVYEHDAFRRIGAYRRAQQTARHSGRGVWRICRGHFHGWHP